MVMSHRVREALSTFGHKLVLDAGRIAEDCDTDGVREVYITIRIDADDSSMEVQKTYGFTEVLIGRETM